MASSGLEKLRIYLLAMEIGETVAQIIDQWDSFSRNSIGQQWVRSTDSIAANIAEGYGRYHYKENRLFCYYSRGSLFESQTWLKKAHNRSLISDAEFNNLYLSFESLAKQLNQYIKSIGNPSIDH